MTSKQSVCLNSIQYLFFINQVIGLCLVRSNLALLPLFSISLCVFLDPYVKVNLYQGKKRVCKKKTHVKKCTPNPVFNELFVFDVPSEEGLRDTSVELLLLDSDRTAHTPVIGRLLLGTSTPGTAGEHWREICDHPRRQIAKWHALAED